MAKYIVTTGQNLFDVALHIYGSLEGLPDILINNPYLTFSTPLETGMELFYSDDFILEQDIVVYNRNHNIIPANFQRSVYFRETDKRLEMEFVLKNDQTSFSASAKGEGEIVVDWGDNSPLQTINLSTLDPVRITHTFNNIIPSERKVRFYGDFGFTSFTLNTPKLVGAYLLMPKKTNELTLSSLSGISLDFIRLFTGLYYLTIKDLTISDLSPLISQGFLKLDLSAAKIKREVMDRYLIDLVNNYGNRPTCHVYLPDLPSGEFKEPEKDENLNYNIKTGMEAIWVILNEPEWNQYSSWKFIINDQIFSNEQDN